MTRSRKGKQFVLGDTVVTRGGNIGAVFGLGGPLVYVCFRDKKTVDQWVLTSQLTHVDIARPYKHTPTSADPTDYASYYEAITDGE